MASLKDYSGRIVTLKNMQKVMRAMNMIATIKLRKLVRLQSSLALFDQSTDGIAQDIFSALRSSSYALVSGAGQVKKAHVILFTADKGLCGSHNSTVQKALDVFVGQKAGEQVTVDATCIGIRGANYCRRKGYEVFHQTEIHERVFNTSSIAQITSKIFQRFLDNDIQEIHLIANYFRTTLQQDTETARLIPFEEPKEKAVHVKAFTEPDPDQFVVSAGELYLSYKLMSALFHSRLSEQSARMTAMENATNNSEDLINHYVMLQNRARQAAITDDLIEIVSGKEALKG